MFQEAIEALRKDDRGRAKDLLTRLLKTDQDNPTYWIWLSAAVETKKERIYCLKTALNLAPQNATAKRGLILLGALPPDDSVAPFPLNHPRLWEEQLVIPEEPKEKKRGWSNPFVRLVVILSVSVMLLGLLYFGLQSSRGVAPGLWRTPTRRSVATITSTPTNTPVYRTVTSTFAAPTPLWMLLESTYTPTPLYVVTQHPVTSSDAFNTGLRYFKQGDYANAIMLFQQVLTVEPNAADAYYYIGECYRMMGDNAEALDAYQRAIDIDAGFAPGYLGRAIAVHAINSDLDVAADLNRAIALDPRFTAAFIGRGVYRLQHGDLNGAIGDLQTAVSLDPNSALAYLYLAQAQLAQGRNKDALESALKANQMDITLLPAYLVLGQAYQANGQIDKAVGVLQTYTLYQPDNPIAFVILGSAYNASGEYELAIVVLDRAVSLNRRLAEAYYQRGFAYLNLGDNDQAERDFKLAVGYDPYDFDASLGLGLAYYQQEHYGDAYLQIERAKGLADSDKQDAQVYYWEAVCLEQLNETQAARRNWRLLLDLPEEVVPAEWRAEAFERITPTPTPRPTRTPTPSSTPTSTP